MGQDPETIRQPRHLGRGFFTSLLIHSGLLFPLITLAFVLGAQEEKEREEQVEMSFNDVDPTTLPEDLPPIDPSKPEPKKKEALAMKVEPPVRLRSGCDSSRAPAIRSISAWIAAGSPWFPRKLAQVTIACAGSSLWR